jgi:hypothetical protein
LIEAVVHRWAAVGIALSASCSAVAYETATHRLLSTAAAGQSQLATDLTLLSNLGLPPLDSISLPDGSTLVYTASDNVTTGSALTIIARGAELEDSLVWNRSLNHFYDPQYQANGLFGRGFLSKGVKSPDWALGDLGEPSDYFGNTNLFSYRRAEQYFYAGLTGADPAARAASYSQMFQSLGPVIHHLQDMGQPQHTRNDSHFHEPFIPSMVTPGGFYEEYTNSPASPLTYTPSGINALVSAGQYGTPDFQSVRQYWYTAGNPQPAYLGMAEFTADNFVSQGTEFLGNATVISPPPQFPYPNGNGKTIQRVTETATFANGSTLTGPVDYVIGSVYDAFTGYTSSHRLAARSLLDTYAHNLPFAGGVWTENTAVFDNNYSALLPRAVGFSAGLINHFFRGRLSLTRSAPTSLNWSIANLSTSPNGTMSGTFKVYAEDGNHVRAPLSGAVWSLNIPKGGASQVSFNDPPAGTQNLVLVFNGSMGGEPSNTNDSGWYAAAGTVVKYTAPPSVCTAARSDGGGSEGINYTRDLGPTGGNVQVQFEAFYVPDGLVVKSANAAGTVLATTKGLVSGLHNFSFNFDPLGLGSTSINVVVTGNTNATAWQVAVGCPGQPLSGNNALPQETVVFSFGTALSPATGSCLAKVYVDGTLIGNALADTSSPHTLSAVLTRGQGHGISYSNFSCGGLTRNVVPTVSYVDAAGPHPLPNFDSTDVTLFNVN